MTEKISDDRLRNTRAWAATRIGSLSGAEVIVEAIDELLNVRTYVPANPQWCPNCGQPHGVQTPDSAIVKEHTEGKNK